MRTIKTHAVNPANEAIELIVKDAPGSGGASHHYVAKVEGADNGETIGWQQDVQFQNGPIAEAGVNGTTHEVLLAIVADRLESFQAGPYACDENAMALAHVREALHALLSRTRARQARGVEGTHVV